MVVLHWENPIASPNFSGIKIVRKIGAVPFDPYDGELVYDGLRNYSPKAWILAIPGTPAPPNPVASSGAGCVHLSWVAVPGADHYRVYRRTAGEEARLVAEPESPYYNDCNVRMQTYEYWVTSVDDEYGEGQPSAVVGAAPSPVSWDPNAPTVLTTEAITNTSITLTWADNSDNEVCFVLERLGPGETGWQEIARPWANRTSYVDEGLTPGAAYSYRIKAVSWDRESGYAVLGSVMTDATPLAPANLTWTIISAGRINLAWTDAAENETGYRVYITGSDGTDRVMELAAGAASCSVTGLAPGVVYTFRVEAYNAAGASAAETEAVVTGTDPKDDLFI